GGGGVGRGYWQRAELTGERYVPHPYSAVGGERLYRTGDEGRYLEDGRIEYLGRADQQVKVRGYRIELEEIGAVLESHEAVRQAVVTVREEQQLVAYLVGRRGVQWQELKIDVQRAEWDVLQGLEAEDWERIGQVVLEVHDWEGGSGRAAAIGELLQAKGYEVTVAQDELLVGTDRYNVSGVRRGYRKNGNGNGHAQGNGNGQAALLEAEEEEEEWSNGDEWEVSEVKEYARERLPE